MKLTKFEQSGFILETNNGFLLAFDIGNKTPVEKLEGIHTDVFIVSHIHGDHFHPENIAKLLPQKILLPQECSDALTNSEIDVSGERVITHDKFVFENNEIKVSFFNVDHGPNISAPIENLGFLIEADGKKIYFAGDMYYPSGIDVGELEVDYALIPVGGHYTFGPAEAFEFAKTFKKIGKIISMHYEKNNFIDPIRHEEFLQLSSDLFKVE